MLLFFLLWGKNYHNAIPFSRNLKTVCSAAWHSRRHPQYEDFIVFGCLTVLWIRKGLDASNGHYEGKAAQNPYSDRSDERTSKFVGEIKAMIDNAPSKSIRTKTRDMRVFDFV